MSRFGQAMRLRNCVTLAVVVTSMIRVNLYAGPITFPVGTPIGFSSDLFGFVHTVERERFGFCSASPEMRHPPRHSQCSRCSLW